MKFEFQVQTVLIKSKKKPLSKLCISIKDKFFIIDGIEEQYRCSRLHFSTQGNGYQLSSDGLRIIFASDSVTKATVQEMRDVIETLTKKPEKKSKKSRSSLDPFNSFVGEKGFRRSSQVVVPPRRSFEQSYVAPASSYQAKEVAVSGKSKPENEGLGAERNASGHSSKLVSSEEQIARESDKPPKTLSTLPVPKGKTVVKSPSRGNFMPQVVSPPSKGLSLRKYFQNAATRTPPATMPPEISPDRVRTGPISSKLGASYSGIDNITPTKRRRVEADEEICGSATSNGSEDDARKASRLSSTNNSTVCNIVSDVKSTVRTTYINPSLRRDSLGRLVENDVLDSIMIGESKQKDNVMGSRVNGIKNMGNTCFMGATVQALCALDGFVSDFLSPFWKSVLCHRVNERELSENMICVSALITLFSQHDAHEFLSDILTSLEEQAIHSLRKLFHGSSFYSLLVSDSVPNEVDNDSSALDTVCTPVDGSSVSFSASGSTCTSTPCTAKPLEHMTLSVPKAKHISSSNCEADKKLKYDVPPLIMQLVPTVKRFLSIVEMTLKCTSCGQTRTKKEHYHDFSLLLSTSSAMSPSNAIRTSSRIASQNSEMSSVRLEELIESFFANDTRDLACDFCKNKSAKVEVSNAIDKLADVVVLQLKRFEYDPRLCDFHKIQRRVRFPAVVDMYPYCGENSSELTPSINTAASGLDARNILGEAFTTAFPELPVKSDMNPARCSEMKASYATPVHTNGPGGLYGGAQGDSEIINLANDGGTVSPDPMSSNLVDTSSNEVHRKNSVETHSRCVLSTSWTNDETEEEWSGKASSKGCAKRRVLSGVQSADDDDTNRAECDDAEKTPPKLESGIYGIDPESFDSKCGLWVCSQCTYENISSHLACSACNTLRNDDEATTIVPESSDACNKSLRKQQMANSKLPYELVAVVRHMGRTAAAGHYTCDVLRSDPTDPGHERMWYRCDDSRVYPTSEDAVLSDQSSPYLLFYQRVKGQVAVM